MADISTCKAMTDHFEGIDKLVKEAPHTDGAPNFRRVRNFGFHQKFIPISISNHFKLIDKPKSMVYYIHNILFNIL